MGGLRQDGVPRTPSGRDLRKQVLAQLTHERWCDIGYDASCRCNAGQLLIDLIASERELAQLPASDALDPFTHASERCPNRWKCTYKVGSLNGYVNERLHSADLAAHYWVGCGRITAEQAHAILLRARAGEPSEPGGGAGE